MRKWIKEVFPKNLIFSVYIPGILFIILGLIISMLSDKNIFISIAQFLFTILIFRIPFWVLLMVALVGFIFYQIKRRVLNEKQKFILSILHSGEVGLTLLSIAYKKHWPKEGRIKTQCAKILDKLESLNLVEFGCLRGGRNSIQEERFRATEKGKKHLKKIDVDIKEKAEKFFDVAYREVHDLESIDEEIECYKKDIIFMLSIPANAKERQAFKDSLRKDYFRQFRDKDDAHFNYIWSIMERKKLIEYWPSEYGDIYINDKGLKIYNENR